MKGKGRAVRGPGSPGDGGRLVARAWLAAGKTAALKVPSAPVHEEWNVLLTPRHADLQRIKEVSVRCFQFDQ